MSSGNIPLWPDGTNSMIIQAPLIGLLESEEVDALSWGKDLVVLPSEVQKHFPLTFYFSVDYLTTGLQGTAVYTESQSGNILGDIFFSDFSGMDWKVLDGSNSIPSAKGRPAGGPGALFHASSNLSRVDFPR
ncbi:MAG: hypothetical protein JW958_00635 [Candidatus Eisenbacteria bacterium]|nr:hypothetical protein [Candidatus Eisenbacteria bacterium]